MDKCNLLDFYNIKSIPNDELWEFVTIPGPLIYRIYNTITFKSYIGFTKIHLHSRFFTGWRGGHFGYYENPNLNHHLYKSMRKYGLDKFTLEILKLNPEEGDEEKFIKEYDSYNNGYNLSINGLGYTYEGEYMQFFNKITHEQVKVRDFEADKYLQDENWERGNINMKGQIWINNGIDCIRIHPDEYDKSEWRIGNLNLIGNSHTLGKICINNGKVKKVVTESEFISEWKPKGWEKGDVKGKISINKDGTSKMIFRDELDKYKSKGWNIGQGYESSSKGRIHITDGTHNKMIYPEDLQKYEYDGWRLGRTMNKSSKGKIIINNGLFNKMISSENFPEYEETGWKLGMIRK
jgi:hypothetical protein